MDKLFPWEKCWKRLVYFKSKFAICVKFYKIFGRKSSQCFVCGGFLFLFVFFFFSTRIGKFSSVKLLQSSFNFFDYKEWKLSCPYTIVDCWAQLYTSIHRRSVWSNYLAGMCSLGFSEAQEVDKSGWYQRI